MHPVIVSVEVPRPREDIYDFLDVMANHESFTDHMMRDSGPDRGVGSKAHAKVKTGGRTDDVDIEVISGERPTRITEQNISARGRRVANGTYILGALPGGTTRVTFEYSWQRAPVSDRLAAPLVRSIMRRRTERAMRRLAHQLSAASNREPEPSAEVIRQATQRPMEA